MKLIHTKEQYIPFVISAEIKNHESLIYEFRYYPFYDSILEESNAIRFIQDASNKTKELPSYCDQLLALKSTLKASEHNKNFESFKITSIANKKFNDAIKINVDLLIKTPAYFNYARPVSKYLILFSEFFNKDPDNSTLPIEHLDYYIEIGVHHCRHVNSPIRNYLFYPNRNSIINKRMKPTHNEELLKPKNINALFGDMYYINECTVWKDTCFYLTNIGDVYFPNGLQIDINKKKNEVYAHGTKETLKNYIETYIQNNSNGTHLLHIISSTIEEDIKDLL